MVSAQPNTVRTEMLACVQRNCPHYSRVMWQDYENRRRIRTLHGVVQLRHPEHQSVGEIHQQLQQRNL
ncbi:MAG: hypothetical protein HC851_12420 [Acaryochloris sp. RU_4_1]|nr:hypothetical protein [Acaryochloris sp. RU_4_1]NJR55000.1 hypothetical protein [Acaryochloris sp. CRU_2_0]